MKTIIETSKIEGLESLLGERITLFCAAYIYTGKLVGVSNTYVKLQDPSIVYETGELSSKSWQDAQPLPNDWYVQLNSVESFGILK